MLFIILTDTEMGVKLKALQLHDFLFDKLVFLSGCECMFECLRVPWVSGMRR